jgi:hypothetical protein
MSSAGCARHLPVVERSDGSDRLLGMVDVLQLT